MNGRAVRCAFSLSGAFAMSSWIAIISKALSNIIEETHRAVPGAKLRAEVEAVAADWGVSFPPPEMTKFSSFVESFDKEFIVLRRPGSDILVAPADRADLFTAAMAASPTSYSRMRQDLFEALTTIEPSDRGVPFYLLDSDSVRWIRGQDSEIPNDAIPLPMTTMEGEVRLRRDFADSIEESSGAQNALKSALDDGGPLRSFTVALQEHGFSRLWHLFRLRHLSTKLRDWSVAHAVNWQRGWLSSNESGSLLAAPLQPDSATRTQLAELLMRATDEDLRRVMVPLDIVLRISAAR